MIKFLNGFILCEQCEGSGKIFLHKVNLSWKNCSMCDGQGIRKPTWTEQITLKDKLKDCIYNYGLEKCK